MNLRCKSVICNRNTTSYKTWTPNVTRRFPLPPGCALLAELRRNYGVRVIRLCLSGTEMEGVLLALRACIDVRVYLRGETARAKASSTWLYAHGRSVYKHYPGILLRERRVSCYVTGPITNSISSRFSPSRSYYVRTAFLDAIYAVLLFQQKPKLQHLHDLKQKAQSMGYINHKNGRKWCFPRSCTALHELFICRGN